VRDRLKDFYSPPGRPSSDPEVLLRLLFVGHLYGITGERRLLEDVRVAIKVIPGQRGVSWYSSEADF